jgi:hypothetical protein
MQVRSHHQPGYSRRFKNYDGIRTILKDVFFQISQSFRGCVKAKAITGLCLIIQTTNSVLPLVKIDTNTMDSHTFSSMLRRSGSMGWPDPLPIQVLNTGLAVIGLPQFPQSGHYRAGRQSNWRDSFRLPNELCTSPESVG